MSENQALRPETTWLLDTCRRLMSDEPGSCSPPPADTEWRELAAMVVTSRTASLLGWGVRTGHVRMNGELNEVVKATYRTVRDQSSLFVDEVASIAATIPGGTRALARKGLHLSQLYPAAGTRPFSDADLLIHPADEPAVHEALTDLEFQQGRLIPELRSVEPWNRTEELYFRIATNALPYYVKILSPDAPLEWVVVDLSTKVLPPSVGESLSVDDVWLSRRHHPAVPLPIMGDEHLVIDLSVNLYVTHSTLSYIHSHRYRRLLPYLDLLAVAPSVDWAQVAQLCTEHPQLSQPVGFAIGNLCRLFPDAISPDLATRLVPMNDLELLDRVGEFELNEPYLWSSGLAQRMLELPRPQNIPATTSPI